MTQDTVRGKVYEARDEAYPVSCMSTPVGHGGPAVTPPVSGAVAPPFPVIG